MKNSLKILLTLSMLFFIVPSKTSIAQTSDSLFTSVQHYDTTYLPSRGKHIFTSIQSVDDPFVSTKFLLGFGTAQIIESEIPVTIGEYSKTITYNPDITYVTGGANIQFAVRDWAALKIKGYGLAKLGNNFFSLASEGISAASNFSIGWLFRIAQNEDLMFSGAIDLNQANLTFINIFGPADTTITPTDTLIQKQVFSNFQSLTTSADLRFAFKFSNVFGALTRLSGALGDFYAGENESQFQYTFGLALSIDLRNWISIPFGIGLGGSITSTDWRFQEAKPPLYSTNLNIAFINRNDFTLGVEGYVQFVEPPGYDVTFKYFNARLYMGYYF